LTKVIKDGVLEEDWDWIGDIADTIDRQDTTELVDIGLNLMEDANDTIKTRPQNVANVEMGLQVQQIHDQWVDYWYLIRGLPMDAPTESPLDRTPSPGMPDHDPSDSDIPDTTQRMQSLDVSSLFHSARMSFILFSS
jgi:hypothetical protein